MGETRGHGSAGAAADTVYALVGGAAWFRALDDRFYDRVELDPTLMTLYPESDTTGARERLTGFLVQYWGGPTDYSDARGHPRLRMRHAPFRVGPVEREAWFTHMTESVREAALAPEIETAMIDYFDHAATAMINWDGKGPMAQTHGGT